MPKKMISSRGIPFFKVLISILFLFSTKAIHAQCAGNDAALTICDYANPANQSINLFNLLGGTPTPGGIWSDPLQTGALDSFTGILNVWNIHLSGMYIFNYTVSVPGCIDNTSTVTLTLGGYSGIPSPNGSACSDDDHVNLFGFFVGTPPNPHLNGSWHDDDNSGAMQGHYLNATTSGLGTFHFTYTMPAIGTCPATSSTITVTVFRVPFPGIPAKLILCNTTDFSLLTNFDLFSLLAGPDPNGQWSESGTSELSGPFDNFIDIQHLYNTFGLGTYSFVYTVYPENPVCDIKKATVQIVIEEPLDFTGAVFTVNSDICENEIGSAAYSATLTQGTIINPPGPYVITYEVSSGGLPTSHTVTASFDADGILTFPLSSSYFPQVGTYNVTITHIVYTGNFGACENIIDASDDLHIYPIPKINAATLNIDAVCQDSDVVVQLSGTNNLGTGDYLITYNLTGSNTLDAQTITINAVTGVATFTIPAGLIPNPGTTAIHITNIVNPVTGCANTSTLTKTFVINPIVAVTVTANIDDVCQNQPVSVSLTGLSTLGGVTIAYDLSGANASTNQTITVLASGGHANFIIPAGQLPNTGTTTFTITGISNSLTACPVNINLISDDFTINATPLAPAANDAAFCAVDHATVADLVPNGSQFNWYDSATGISPLSNETALVTGNYYVSEINGTTNCPSDRTAISVVVTVVPDPVLNPDGASFCGIDNPTLQDLANNTNAGNIVWYDAPSNGNQLSNSDLLQQGFTYYGFGASDNGCVSEQVLSVTVTLTNCDGTTYDFFIPDGFSPNGDNVNDVFQIPEIQYLFPDYTLEIYNRYGDLMFKGNINSPAWDGKNSRSGSLIDGIASNGVYFYIVNFNKDNAPPRQGFLYLNR